MYYFNPPSLTQSDVILGQIRTTSVDGHVGDADTKQVLPSANVYSNNTGHVTNTDERGLYQPVTVP